MALVLAVVLLLVISLCTVNTRLVRAQSSGIIYIRPDGSVEGTDKIQRDGNVYTLTGNIYGPIFVERDNIIIDGNGYTLHAGTETTHLSGIYLSGRKNVMVRNTQIKSFQYGIILDSHANCNNIIGNNIENNYHGIWVVGSSNNTIIKNNIKNRSVGIYMLSSSDNIISGNNITNHVGGICLISSSNNTISGNNLANNEFCIYFSSHSNYNSIIGNNIRDNSVGISLWYSSNNLFFHNNFINNKKQVSIPTPGYANFWDNGVEGNYWSDYEDRYPNATELDDSCIWGTPYVISENNQDNYPLMNPVVILPRDETTGLDPTHFIITVPIVLAITLGAAIYRRKRSPSNKTP